MTDDFDPPSPADLDADGRDLILAYADDRVYLHEVLAGLGLPDLAAVRARLTARRLISEPMPQTRTRAEVLAERRARDREIDDRYRDVPVAWPGPLDTDEQIAAASVAMQREAEGEAGQRTVLIREDYGSLPELTDAIEAVRSLGRPFSVIWRADNAVQYHDPTAGERWKVRQIPDVDELGVDTSDEDAAIREMTVRALSGRDDGAVERELTAVQVRFRRRTPEEMEELGRRALDVLRKVPRVPPDEGDEMPD